MAYLARTDPRQRFQVQQEGMGGVSAQVPGAAPGASPVSAPPTSGGSFQAVRGFFEANRASADDTARRALGNVDEQAQQAVDLAGASEDRPENFGGIETAAEATAARDEALERIAASGTQSGIESLLSQGRDATYTQGQRAADAAIAGRSNIMRDVQEKWGGTLGALQPAYASAVTDPGPEPTVPPVMTVGLAEWNKAREEYERWKKQKDAYDAAVKKYGEPKSDKKDGE